MLPGSPPSSHDSTLMDRTQLCAAYHPLVPAFSSEISPSESYQSADLGLRVLCLRGPIHHRT